MYLRKNGNFGYFKSNNRTCVFAFYHSTHFSAPCYLDESVLLFVQPVLIIRFNLCVAYTTLMCLARHRSNIIQVHPTEMRGDSTINNEGER